MYRSKQMQWSDVNANGMSNAVGQAAQATALLQEANKGLSGIGDSISKVGDSVTKYGTDMETRYNKEKTEIIEGIAHDIYNSAIADSTDANGRINLDTFDKVVTMGMTSLGQGYYAMDKKDINSVLKHVHSLMNRSDATQNNVSIMNHNLAQSQFTHEKEKFIDGQNKIHFRNYQEHVKGIDKTIHNLFTGLTPAQQEMLSAHITKAESNQKAVVLTQVNNILKNHNKKELKYYSELEHIFNSEEKLKEVFGEDMFAVMDLVYGLPTFVSAEALKYFNKTFTDNSKTLERANDE